MDSHSVSPPRPSALAAACLAALLAAGCGGTLAPPAGYYPSCSAEVHKLVSPDAPPGVAVTGEDVITCYEAAHARVMERYRAGELSRGAVLRRHDEIVQGMRTASDALGDQGGDVDRRRGRFVEEIDELLPNEPEGGVVPIGG